MSIQSPFRQQSSVAAENLEQGQGKGEEVTCSPNGHILAQGKLTVSSSCWQTQLFINIPEISGILECTSHIQQFKLNCALTFFSFNV